MKKVVLILTLLLIGCAESFDRFYINPEIAYTENEYRFSLGHNFTLLTWDKEYDVSISSILFAKMIANNSAVAISNPAGADWVITKIDVPKVGYFFLANDTKSSSVDLDNDGKTDINATLLRYEAPYVIIRFNEVVR